jgi:predicted metal-dependent hydrolase
MNCPQDIIAVRRDFRARVRIWAERIKVRPKRVEVRRMSRKWASCSSRRCVSFAELLLEQPSPFQDYVIVHELLHLRVRNHGKLFKSLLSAHLPSWRTYSGIALTSALRDIKRSILGVSVEPWE